MTGLPRDQPLVMSGQKRVKKLPVPFARQDSEEHRN
jgi:hypothetical protein